MLITIICIIMALYFITGLIVNIMELIERFKKLDD